ncbi:DMT family transporter [Vibrio ziniensis]|uniref:EamA family transporter n=1 Tax=Vibrio ziniensis TaxID=2711221 RepID=A0A6G7CNU5_9VIBR|nr:DMT family transporter [Vibrio ziniensis]QIH43698.1 EamA family transporter [Vibrio ziniensis]
MRLSDYTRLLALAAIWGASFLFMRITVPEFGAINSAFLRVFFGFAGLAVILLVLRCPIRFEGKFRACFVLGIINSGVPFMMYCIAAQWLPAGYSAVLNATTPLMGALIGFSFFAEKLTISKWAAVILGAVGITIITTFGEAESAQALIFGGLACLVATSCYAVSGFLTRQWINNQGGLDSKIVAFGSQIGATTFLLPLFLFTSTTDTSINWAQGEVWGCIIALGVICTACAYIVFFRLISDIGPLRAMTVTFLIPPFAILWGFVVLDEEISQGFILGSLIVAIAVWLIVRPVKQDAVKA